MQRDTECDDCQFLIKTNEIHYRYYDTSTDQYILVCEICGERMIAIDRYVETPPQEKKTC